MAQSEMLLSCYCSCNFSKFLQTLTDKQVQIGSKQEREKERKKGRKKR